jgi:hydroxyacylglutathione hydrolase
MVNRHVNDHETLSIGEIKLTGLSHWGWEWVSLHTLCHTQDSVSFFLEQDGSKAVFTGDTLFIGGCGKFFEVTPPHAVNDRERRRK